MEISCSLLLGFTISGLAICVVVGLLCLSLYIDSIRN